MGTLAVRVMGEASWTPHATVESTGEKFQQLDGALIK